jgi:hypothetical protein
MKGGLALTGPLGGLQWIYLVLDDDLLSVYVTRQVASPKRPLAGGIGEDLAVLSRREIYRELAALTLLDDSAAVTSIKRAPLLGHEGAIKTLSNRCANHRIVLSAL